MLVVLRHVALQQRRVVVLVPAGVDHRLPAGQRERGGVPLAAQAAGDDGGGAQRPPGQLVADDPRLLPADVGQHVVVLRPEGGLAVPDEQDDRHQPRPATRRHRSSRYATKNQKSLNAGFVVCPWAKR